ncbi:LysR family transcriptional regulator [Neorhizobium huautlense]|uniref:LysR family transcriptional regulator n=1 Tax=Neorhizobium huautlense TaxID=67774 RepID=UPI0027D927D1|nr:LysR family transcriptional regulator [Neorhizobium huautlense]
MSSILSIESLGGLIAFSVAVETGSFAAAGRKLGLSSSAVGKSVERLEARLGLRLLNRTTRSLAVTGEGDVLNRYVARILKDLQDAEQELHQLQAAPRGRLKVSVPTVLGRKVIMPALRHFQIKFPDITTDILLDDVKVAIIEGGYDVVLRLGELDESTLRARRIGPHTFTTCASPCYLTQFGIPQNPADLHDHDCIFYRFPTTGRPETWAFKCSSQLKPIKPAIILNDGEALASAALGGLGIIQVPSYLVRDDLAAGRLQSVLADYTEERGSVSLVWPPMSARAPKVRAFIEFMAEQVFNELY